MSITSLIRTLTAASMEGVTLFGSFDDTVIVVEVFSEDASEQTAEITSHTSAGFNRSVCCSLTKKT